MPQFQAVQHQIKHSWHHSLWKDSGSPQNRMKSWAEVAWTHTQRQLSRTRQPALLEAQTMSQLGFDLLFPWLLISKTKQDRNKPQVFSRMGAVSVSHSALMHRDKNLNLTATATLHNLKGLERSQQDVQGSWSRSGIFILCLNTSRISQTQGFLKSKWQTPC